MIFFNKLIPRLQTLFFLARLRITAMLGLPAQTGREIEIFKSVFDYFSDNEILRIFEWGSGNSTIYYSEYLRKKGVKFEWHTLDNNKTWHEKVKLKIKKKGLQSYIQSYFKDFLPFWEKPDWGPIPPVSGTFSPKSENEKAYVNFPAELNSKFDIIIVDARFRRHCIQTAKKILPPDGIIIMHDAEKEHYHVGLDDFQYRKFFISGSWYPLQKIPNKVWIGSMGNNKIFEALKQF